MSYLAAIIGFIVGFAIATIGLGELLPYEWWLDFREQHSWAMPMMGVLQVAIGVACGAIGFFLFR